MSMMGGLTLVYYSVLFHACIAHSLSNLVFHIYGGEPRPGCALDCKAAHEKLYI